MKNFIIGALVIGLAGAGIYFLTQKSTKVVVVNEPTPTQEEATTTPEVVVQKETTVIGKSVEDRDITAYHYGKGSTEILLVGGVHGGYSWNTSLVAYEAMDYLKANPGLIPNNVKVTVIPVLNPDGLNKVVGTPGRFTAADVSKDQTVVVSGRFNAHEVDLNRNFDCDWQASGTWQNKTVSGGTRAFSEPETAALKAYVEANKPAAVVGYYSAAGGVYASNCHNGISTETSALVKEYADASGYRAYQTFDFYKVTGDMVNWLAKNNIPAISILLTNHTDTEWTKNQKGIDALLKHFAK